MEKENKLGTMPISKLIINMSLPIIASMLVQALYTLWTACSCPGCVSRR